MASNPFFSDGTFSAMRGSNSDSDEPLKPMIVS
jgi:hypothetical protein